MKTLVTIYGLFDPQGICLYVGATIQPKKREKDLRRGVTNRPLCKHAWEFRQLAQCLRSKASALEKKTIRHYKALGQSRFNKLVIGWLPISRAGRKINGQRAWETRLERAIAAEKLIHKTP